MAKGMILRRGGNLALRIPKFTYTGQYILLDDGEDNWRIKFLTSGTLTMQRGVTIDAFLVGGGTSGSVHYDNAHVYGGSGGFTTTVSSIVLTARTAYQIVVGAGGASALSANNNGNAGGDTTAFDILAEGGRPRHSTITVHGGSGGAGSGNYRGGTDGGNGYGSNPGIGQGTTTREFGEATGDLYAGGGGSGSAAGGEGGGGTRGVNAGAGAANTGGGGCSGIGSSTASGAGGSGIVVIRNHREVAA